MIPKNSDQELKTNIFFSKLSQSLYMDRGEVEALADIAYGIFEHFLNNQLHARRTPLFRLVEEEKPFQKEFDEIYTTFKETYPDLAGSLEERFSSPEEMYRLLCEGEGIIPSKTTQTHWIIEDAPEIGPSRNRR